MKHEFHAEFPLALKDSTTLSFAVDFLSGRSESPPYHWKELSMIKDDFCRLMILSQAIATGHKDYARAGSRKNPSGLKFWIENRSRKFLSERLSFMNQILKNTLPDLSLLPPNSWALRIEFKLKKPYISRDDMDFYIIDNPVRKEWVFKVPYVAPSQWKGALRAAMIRELVKWWQNPSDNKPNPQEFAKRRFQLALLFGSEKGEELNSVKGLAKYLDKVGGEEAAAIYRNLIRQYFDISPDNSIPHFVGKLYFYPTYFKHIGLEVINPHDRKTGAGTKPIYMECVPSETEGTLQVLYIPLNGNENSDEDLKAVTKGIKAMLTEYGFGAKTSSGYGIAEMENPSENIYVLPENLKDKVIKYWTEDNHERT